MSSFRHRRGYTDKSGVDAINPSEKYYQPEFYKKILFDKII